MKRTNNSDGRKADLHELNQRRRTAVLLRAKGVTVQEAAEHASLSRQTVISAFKAYKAGGLNAVRVERRGKPQGAGKKLTPEQELDVQHTLRGGPPSEHGLPGQVWSPRLASELIKRRCRVSLPVRSLQRYLHLWGFAASPLPLLDEHPLPADYLAQVRDYHHANVLAAREVRAKIRWCEAREIPPLRPVAGADSGTPPDDESDWQSIFYLVTLRGDIQWRVFDGPVSCRTFAEFLEHVMLFDHQHQYVLWEISGVNEDDSDFTEWCDRSADRITLRHFWPRWMVRQAASRG